MKSYIKIGLIAFVAILTAIFALVNHFVKEPTIIDGEIYEESASVVTMNEEDSLVSQTYEESQTNSENKSSDSSEDYSQNIISEVYELNTTVTKAVPVTQPIILAETTAAKVEKATQSSTYAYSYAGYNPKLADLSGDYRLWLVNRDYILPEGYSPTLAYSVTGDSDSKKLDYRVAPYYNKMYQAAKADGITLTTLSGFRSYEKQKTNFENKINTYINQGYSKVKATQEAATIILPPGTSEHNAGLAMDICSLYESFENSKEYAWLDKNAQDYGFILRYPKDKQNITKIIYEPWHWRFVGVDNAKAIKSSGKCLEEWLGK